MEDIKETCADCKYCTKLYVPPCKRYEYLPKDAYVCTLFIKDAEQVMFLEDTKSLCEMHTPDTEKEVLKLYASGVTVKEIMQKTNYSQTSVYRIIEKSKKGVRK